MRVIRSIGQNVSPSDDAKLYERMFVDGLFDDVNIASLGSNQVSIDAMYGIMQGRDFTSEAQTLTVALPPTSDSKGYIYVQFDLSTDEVISFGSALDPFTPTYEDINGTGTICQMIIAEYDANAIAVTDITPTYNLTGISGTKEVTYVLLASQWTLGAYDIASPDIHADDTIELTYPHTLTDTQYLALQDAQTRITGFSEGHINIRALGIVPNVDIPIILVIWR